MTEWEKIKAWNAQVDFGVQRFCLIGGRLICMVFGHAPHQMRSSPVQVVICLRCERIVIPKVVEKPPTPETPCIS